MSALGLLLNNPALGGGDISYTLHDAFTTALAAGAVNGTLSEPGPGTRNVIDTAGTNVLITGGQLSITGTGTWNQAGIWYTPAITRQSGLVLSFETISLAAAAFRLGGFTTATDANFGGYNNVGLMFNTGGSGGVMNARRATDGTSPLIAPAGTAVGKYYIVLRALGRYVFSTVGGVTKLLWWDAWDNTPSLYAGIAAGFVGAGVHDNFKLPQDRYYAATAQASDSFNRADGAIGSTDGAGHAEANSGSGKAWTARKGTWAVATNAAACSGLTDSLGIVTVDAGTADVCAEVATTRAGDNVGLVLRWADADNYLIAYTEGTNAVLVQRLAGTPSTLITAAVTYAAGAKLRVHLDGARALLYYSDLYVGTSAVVNAALTGTHHGLYTTNIGNIFDNFVCFARNGYTDLGAY